jgi:phage gp37-like protein
MAAVRGDRSPPVQADVRRVLRDKLEPKQKDLQCQANLRPPRGREDRRLPRRVRHLPVLLVVWRGLQDLHLPRPAARRSALHTNLGQEEGDIERQRAPRRHSVGPSREDRRLPRRVRHLPVLLVVWRGLQDLHLPRPTARRSALQTNLGQEEGDIERQRAPRRHSVGPTREDRRLPRRVRHLPVLLVVWRGSQGHRDPS